MLLTERCLGRYGLIQLGVVAQSDRVFGRHAEQVLAAFPEFRYSGSSCFRTGLCHGDPVVPRCVAFLDDVGLDGGATVRC